MKIVTTPMCEKILEFAGITEYKVNKDPDKEDGDLAILLSEGKTKMNSLNIKLNTFLQIKDSIIEVSKLRDNNNELFSKENQIELVSKENQISKNIKEIFSKYPLATEWLKIDKKKKFQEKNSKIRVKVYSKFIHEIVEDMGFDILDSNYDGCDFDYIIYPDYMNINHNNCTNIEIIPIPTHENVPKDPIKRAELRYSILNNI